MIHRKPLTPFVNMTLLVTLGVFSLAVADAAFVFFARRLGGPAIPAWLVLMIVLFDLAVVYGAVKALRRVAVITPRKAEPSGEQA